jgi:glycerophosphoryl diester phosphodiesterase
MAGTLNTQLIAHRGASREAPENTLAAFDLAWREGADGIESDFRLTRDGRVVCIHDATTGRTADRDISVADATLEELRTLDMGAWKGEQWRGERIVTLEEVLEQLPAGKKLFIELKSGAEIIGPLEKILHNATGDTGRICILAFDAVLLAQFKRQLSGIGACLNVEYRWNLRSCSWHPTPEDTLATLERIGANGLSSQDHALLDRHFVDELRCNGKEVHVWTVDSERRAGYYLGLGVDSIMTNRPGWLRERLTV